MYLKSRALNPILVLHTKTRLPRKYLDKRIITKYACIYATFTTMMFPFPSLHIYQKFISNSAYLTGNSKNLGVR